MTSGAPRAVIGIPAYNHAHQFRETLKSLLIQTCGDLAIVISDDGSKDETKAIALEYAARDDRVVYQLSSERLGYIGNARRCFELATELFPDAEFFAWGSDHDVWHPLWLERLVEALDSCPQAVLAYPGTLRIDGDGQVVSTHTFNLDTSGETDAISRFVTTFQRMSAGNMIYGLMRTKAVARAGIMRWHLLPDRLLISELSLQGPVVGVQDLLWYRRYKGLASKERQRRASFLTHRPAYLYLPWWMAHSWSLFRNYVSAPGADSPITSRQGVSLVILYAALGARHVFFMWLQRVAGRTRHRVRALKKRAWRAARIRMPHSDRLHAFRKRARRLQGRLAKIPRRAWKFARNTLGE